MHKHLPLEEGVMDMLIGGYSFIMLLAVVTVIILWKRNRGQSTAFLWIFAHFILLSIGMYFAFKAISFDLEHVQASEEISILLGESGLSWGVSMICLLLGIFRLSKPIKQ